MGANNGTGQPYWFKCWAERRELFGRRPEDHIVTLTGRQKRVYSRHGGARVTDRQREYKCSCGHVGWSRHIDLADMAGEPKHVDHPEWG